MSEYDILKFDFTINDSFLLGGHVVIDMLIFFLISSHIQIHIVQALKWPRMNKNDQLSTEKSTVYAVWYISRNWMK